MTQIHRGRFGAEIDGDFVVLLIGARLNKPWLLPRRPGPSWMRRSALCLRIRVLPTFPRLCYLRSWRCRA